MLQVQNMKKEILITVRVDSDIKDLIDTIAEKDNRAVAWVTRNLIIEALKARKLLKSKTKSKA